MYSKEVIDIALELNKQGLSSYKIADEISEIIGKKITASTIQNFIKNNNGLSDLNKSVIDIKPYDVVNGVYIFYKYEKDEYGDTVKTPYPVPVDIVDGIFKDYSRHGGNLTGEEVIQKYSLKSETRNLIKSRLRLYKSSNIVSQYTLENLSDGEIDSYLEGKINTNIQDKYKNIFVKKDRDVKKREFIKYSNFFHSQQELLDTVKKSIENYEPKVIGKIEIPKIKNNDTVDIAFSDIHIGKKGTSDIIERLQIMTNYIISRLEKNINLFFLGDLAESLVEGGMHPGQVEEMDGPYGFDLMMYIVEVFENMLMQLYKAGKKVKFIGMPGNHGRISKNHNEDQKRTGALIIYELIKRGLSNTNIDIEYYREKTVTIYGQNFNFVINHGDEGFDKKAQNNAEKILWNNVKNNGKKSVILYGDKHNIKVSEGKDYTAIGLPALAGAGTYDTRLDLHSESGYVVIEKNVSDSADVVIKRF